MQPNILFHQPAAVQIHVACAVGAVLLTPLLFFHNHRGQIHKALGYVWVFLMLTTAVSAFFIHGLKVVGPFSPIHLLIPYTLYGLAVGVRASIRKDFARHEASMRGLAIGALGLAGLLSFWPGRLMSRLVFGDAGAVGFAILCLVAVGLIAAPYACGRS